MTPAADPIRVDCGDPAATARACAAIAAHGYVVLDRLLDAGTVRALHRELVERHPRYLEDVEHPDTLRVGPRRYRVPLSFAGGFADPQVWGHPQIIAIVRRLLGCDAVLEAYGAVVSLAHSMPQNPHRDGPLLFGPGTAPHLPCHALTFSLPLIALDDWVGTTGFWPGSHRGAKTLPLEEDPPHAPDVALGSAVLWDFRVAHSGLSNYSDDARPLLYATYSRVWFRDPTGFRSPGMVRIDLDNAFLRGVPDDRRALFAHLVALR
jgi:hypothetical protein